MLEAFELAHDEIRRICDALEELRAPGRQAEVGRPRADRGARARPRPRDLAADPASRAARGGRDRRRARSRSSLPADHDGLDRGGHRPRAAGAERASPSCSSRQRLAAVEAPVREQFESDLRALTDAEQDSKELKSAKRAPPLRPDRRGRSSCRSRSARRRSTATPAVKDSVTQAVSSRSAAEAIYKDLVRKKIAVEKRRPDGRGTEEIRPIDCEVDGRRRARTARRSSPAARRRS